MSKTSQQLMRLHGLEHPSAGQSPISRRAFVRACSTVLGLAAGTCTLGGSLFGLTGCDSPDALITGVRTVIDDIDRHVEIPAANRLSTVYFTSPLAQIFCLTMAPDLIGGTCLSFNSEQLEYLPAGTDELDNMGSLSGGGSIDVEALQLKDVQIIFSISGTDLTDVNIKDAVDLQTRTGIPVVLIDGSMDRISDSYRLLGDCLGRRERAEELAAYCERIYRDVSDALAVVPESKLVTYYFAEGVEGLQTEPNVSQHSLAFQAARGVNVAADVDPDEEGRSAGTRDNHNMVNVTLDEVRSWDPQFIVSWDVHTRSGASSLILNDPEWAGIRAVREGNVYTRPNMPFAFCDRPPGVNRFLGIQWLANLFYPDYYDVDMVEVVRDFYYTCYWRDISAEQARRILNP
ncbi:MAG: ABC transporter substrate-binding protein [Eggerthellaceae bacterium]|nr:ABC transporter substrate-binding protein [Eggerthellaceae bacterium]